VRNIIDHTHHHFINGLPQVKDQYFILQKYMDLGTHAQIYETAKEFHTMKFNIVESTTSVFNSFYNTIIDAGLIIIQELLLYIFFSSAGIILRICYISYAYRHAANIAINFMDLGSSRTLLSMETIFEDPSVTRKGIPLY
jgi:hypothetical protein